MVREGEKVLRAPNVVFCNLQNSGASAIDPILSEILARTGYVLTPFGPEGTEKLQEFIEKSGKVEPFYHWSHSPIKTFQELIVENNTKFIYLHRDPRDVAISWAHDFKSQKDFENVEFDEILSMVINHNLPKHVYESIKWIKSECLIITFESIKDDTKSVVYKILDYINYFDNKDIIPNTQIDFTIDKFSFEQIVGRRRGEEGATYRNSYMVRKGISGEWENFFSPIHKLQFMRLMEYELIELGYSKPRSYKLGQSSYADSDNKYTHQIVSPPFACGVAWLINALLNMEIKTTNSNFKNHWQSSRSGSKIGEQALNHLSWHLPVLQIKKEFKFTDPINIRWEHRLDFANDFPIPTILFIRDPRDAVYSLYKRNYEKSIDFSNFLRRPDTWPDHFPNLFNFPPMESYAYFCWFWINLQKVQPLMVINFEESKINPELILKKTLDFLKIKKLDDEILDAINQSTFEKARAGMKNMENITMKTFQVARKSQIFEWRSSYKLRNKLFLGKIVRIFIRESGYKLFFQNKLNNNFHFNENTKNEKILSKNSFILNFFNDLHLNNLKLDPQDLLELSIKYKLKKKRLLRLLAVYLAHNFIINIFPDTRIISSRISFNTFSSLNLRFLNTNTITLAIFELLLKMNDETRTTFIKLLGKKIKVRYKLAKLTYQNKIF